MSITYTMAALIETVVFLLILLSGCKKREPRIDPFNSTNIAIPILASYMVLRMGDIFYHIVYHDIHIQAYFKQPRLVILDHDTTLSLVTMVASGIFWFFLGLFMYIWLLKEKSERLKDNLGKRMTAALILIPIFLLVRTALYFSEEKASLQKVIRIALGTLNYTFLQRCLHLFPVLILLFMITVIFVKALRQDFLGIAVITAGILLFFFAAVHDLRIIGGAGYILYPMGLLVAKYRYRIMARITKSCKGLIAASSILTAASWIVCLKAKDIIYALREPLNLRSGYFFTATADNVIIGESWFPIFTIPYIIAALGPCILITVAIVKFELGNKITRTIAASLLEVIWLTSVWRDSFPVAQQYPSVTAYIPILVCVALAPVLMSIVTGKKKEAS